MRNAHATFSHKKTPQNIKKPMTEEIITRKVKKILAALLRLEPEEIEPESELSGDLGADSLELTEFVMALEEEFDVEITDDDAEGILTVEDTVAWLLDHVEGD
jgi:acyl carrier protein